MEWDAAETRKGEDGFQYTQTEFIEHHSGTGEWDAAAASMLPLREKLEVKGRAFEATEEKRTSNWFYSGEDDEVHGPFTLARLRRWNAKGHFHAKFLVRHGSDGEDEPLSEVVVGY